MNDNLNVGNLFIGGAFILAGIGFLYNFGLTNRFGWMLSIIGLVLVYISYKLLKK